MRPERCAPKRKSRHDGPTGDLRPGSPMDLSVVVPTLNAAGTLAEALSRIQGAEIVREIVAVDGGSADGTTDIAKATGARVVTAPRGRGTQFAHGAAAAAGQWLLFLHADTGLGPGWADAISAFMAEPSNRDRAGYFRLVLDDPNPAARRIERWALRRCRWLGLPYGDQGLVVHRSLYDRVGGYRPLALMEDVDLVRRIGRRRLVLLPADAVTSAARYRRDGWIARPLRNLALLGLWHMGVPARWLARLYG